jgi:sporulation protein YlmC with PRC-barrel domain
MTTNQFENSRVSEAALRTGHAPSQDRASPTTEPEISNMIAEGGPVPPEGNTTLVNRPMPDQVPVPDQAPVPDQSKIRGLVAASTLVGSRVLKQGGEELGNIEEIMLDLKSGRIAYAVLSFSGFPGIGNKRFPVPWKALQIDPGEHAFMLDIDRATLEGAPDFDKDNWPDMADPAFARVVHKHYGATPYWDRTAPDAGSSARGRRLPTPAGQSETRH